MFGTLRPLRMRFMATVLTLGALLLPAAAGVVAPANAGDAWVPLDRGGQGTSMFGPIGKFITDASLALPWGPAGRVAYRLDIGLMSSQDPIVYKTTFKAPAGVDLAGMRAAGITLVLSVRNSATATIDLPLPDDGSQDAAFQAALGAMIDQLQPDYIVYGNEVNDATKYSGTVAEFQHLMTLGHEIAVEKGIQDGGAGLMGSVTSQATYADILATQGAAAAAAFKSAAQMGDFDQSLADEANAYIDACSAAGLDYFVWHSYFSSSTAVLDIMGYVEKRFGGPSFINELGWRTGSASTGTTIISALNGAGMPIVLLYGSGLGVNEPDQLWDASGKPTAEGLTISAYLASLDGGGSRPVGTRSTAKARPTHKQEPSGPLWGRTMPVSSEGRTPRPEGPR